jgi:hypothetical protein
MKKRSGRLALSRETLRMLETSGLRNAVGGTDTGMQTSAACELPTYCDCGGGGYPDSACFGSCSCPSVSCQTRHC